MKNAKLDPKNVALSLAGAASVLSLLCALLLAAAPEFTLGFFGSIFHGIDIASIAAPVTLSGVITGLIAIAIIAFVAGWVFAAIYNYVAGRK